eukprot:gene13707-19598_t
MTGVTNLLHSYRKVYWHSRIGLLSFIALFPLRFQGAMRWALMVAPQESDHYSNPIGNMPMPRLEYFQKGAVELRSANIRL